GPCSWLTSMASTLIPARTLPFQQITARLLGRPTIYCCRLIVRRSLGWSGLKAFDPSIAPKNLLDRQVKGICNSQTAARRSASLLATRTHRPPSEWSALTTIGKLSSAGADLIRLVGGTMIVFGQRNPSSSARGKKVLLLVIAGKLAGDPSDN